jgi:hypothetical protein
MPFSSHQQKRFWMKLSLSSIIYSVTAAWSGAPPQYTHYESLLKQHACANGVNYAKLKSYPEFSTVATDFQLDEKSFKELGEKDQIAFLSNLYNYYTLFLVTQHYPIPSIRDIKDPWKQAFVPLFGKTVSLDAIEHEWLRKKYSEPRIHFALNCASYSCPPLRLKPFRGVELESQLEAAVTSFLADPMRNRLQGKIYHASKIFSWYGSDFDAQYGGWKKFLADRAGKSVEDLEFRFQEYDWKLNDSPGCRKK